MTGSELRTWRRERKLTQTELADLLEVHSITVSNWERSIYPIPRWVPRLLAVVERAEGRRAAAQRASEERAARRRHPRSGAAHRPAEAAAGAAHA